MKKAKLTYVTNQTECDDIVERLEKIPLRRRKSILREFETFKDGTPEERVKCVEERIIQYERQQIFNIEYKRLLGQVKHLALTFNNGKVLYFELKDKEYGWRIRWLTRDFLRDVHLPKQLGSNQYGYMIKERR